MRTYKSQSTISPTEWDTQSSKTHTYRNYNVVEIPTTEEAPTMYEYDVDEYTKDEYAELRYEKLRSDINYLASMAGVDLESVGFPNPAD